MVQLSMNETTTFRWSFEEDVANFAAAGIPALGAWRHKLSDCGEQKAAELLAQGGLKVSHLLWAGGFTGSDGRSYRASLDDAVEALRTAAAIQSRVLVVYSGARAGHTINHARRLFRDALLQLTPLAAELDVALAIEPMHSGCAGEFTFLHTLDDVAEMIEAVGSPSVKMVFDTYHLGLDPGVVRRIPEIVRHVAIVQLGDARQPPVGDQDRCPLGEGIIPLGEIVRAFRTAGYDGFFDVELLGEEIESIDYHRLLEHAKKAFEELVGSS